MAGKQKNSIGLMIREYQEYVQKYPVEASACRKDMRVKYLMLILVAIMVSFFYSYFQDQQSVPYALIVLKSSAKLIAATLITYPFCIYYAMKRRVENLESLLGKIEKEK